jgi:antitoxin MazE
MVSKVQKWGDGQGLKLPQEVLDRAHVAVGDSLEVLVGDGAIILKKVATPKYDLAELVARIPEGYRPDELDSGPPVGREEW